MPKKILRLGMGARARALVRISHPDIADAVTYTLAVNDGFNDEHITRGGGVDYPKAPEVDTAEGAIADAFNEDIGSLRAWLGWASRATGGGLPGLAARLLDVPLNSATRADKTYKAELRKLEEYRQGKYKNASGARRARIIALNARLLREGKVNIKVLGDWVITSGKGGKPQGKKFHWWTVEDTPENISILDAGGRGFCGWAAVNYSNVTQSIVELERVYALQIERIKD